MKTHNGMRPQDIVILLKIGAKGTTPWLMKNLASELRISSSEISESLNRSVQAGFLTPDKKRLMKNSLIEFLSYGLKYVYPQHPGSLVRGLPTAHSAPPLNMIIQADDIYVWPNPEGTVRGQSIEPLYPSAAEASRNDRQLYELLALTDALRVGKIREQKIAIEELRKRL